MSSPDGLAVRKRSFDSEFLLKNVQTFLMRSGSNELFLGRDAGVHHARDQSFTELSRTQYGNSLVLKHASPFPVKRNHSIVSLNMLIGLTGRNAAGKGEAARYLLTKSFYYYSLSDAIREEIRSRGEEPTRERLIVVGNELRQKYGANVLAERILAKIEDDKHYAIDSIRNPAEVDAFRAAKHFKLVRIEAPPEVRFQRILNRQRESDPKTYEEFIALENREAEGDDTSQNLVKVELMADYTLVNDSAMETLHIQIDRLLPKLLKEIQRPSWDEYFMNIAKVVASRSNCMKRKVAAIIVRDKRVISTGYNGTPRGTRNCNEGCCPRCNNLAVTGTA